MLIFLTTDDLVVFHSLAQQIGHLSVGYVLGCSGVSQPSFLKEPLAQCAGQTVDSDMWKVNEINKMMSRLRIGDHGPVSAQVLESLLAELLALGTNMERYGEHFHVSDQNRIIC